jgi:RimJ/RimL family protein N-acetyltransferase
MQCDAEPGSEMLTGAQLVSLPAPVDWRRSPPIMCGVGVTLRELRLTDAVSLHEALTPQATRYMSPPPSTADGFERFVVWTQRERAHGSHVCFAVVPDGCDAAVGLFQLRQLEPGFGTAEWGFVLGEKFWGSGLFVEGARLVADFAFDVVGVHRLEARAAVENGRGNGALQKLGANRECILRKSFLRGAEYLDQVLWTIIDDDWRQARAVAAAIFH